MYITKLNENKDDKTTSTKRNNRKVTLCKGGLWITAKFTLYIIWSELCSYLFFRYFKAEWVPIFSHFRGPYVPKLWRLVASLYINSTWMGTNDNQVKFQCISRFITLITKGSYAFKLLFYIIFFYKTYYGWIMIWLCRMSQYFRFQCHHTESFNGYCT